MSACEDAQKLQSILLILDSKTESSASYLARVNLGAYVAAMDSQGWVDISMLARMDESELSSAMDEVKMKSGHKMRLRREVMTYKKTSGIADLEGKAAGLSLSNTGDAKDLYQFRVGGCQSRSAMNDVYVLCKDLKIAGENVYATTAKSHFMFYSPQHDNWRIGRRLDLQKVLDGDPCACASSRDESTMRLVLENDASVDWREWAGSEWVSSSLRVFDIKYAKQKS